MNQTTSYPTRKLSGVAEKRSGGYAETSALSGAQRMKLYKMNGY
jgi:hypothetical protein